MAFRAVALVALIAVACAASVDDCKSSYAAAVGQAKANEDRCRGLIALATCLNTAAPRMSDAERLGGQGFFDAARLSVLCSGVHVAQVSLATLEDSEVQRERRAGDTVSIWDINSKYSALADKVVDKASFAAVQKAVSDLQLGSSDDITNLKDNIMGIVDARLSTLTNQIQMAMDVTLSSLKVITTGVNDVTLARIGTLEGEMNSVSDSATADINQQISFRNTAVMKTIAEVSATASTLVGKITTVEAGTDVKINATLGDTKTKVASLMTAIGNTPLVNKQLPIYRVAVWSTYGQNQGWYAGNNVPFFGGVNPSQWTDGNGAAHQMSSDKNVLRALFTRVQYGGTNANVNSHEWYAYSSTNGQMTAALFRIRNTSPSNIVWRTFFFYSSYTGWSETASAALNGNNQWVANNNCGGSCNGNLDLTMPANRVSTAIFISSSGPDTGTRSNVLIFYNDCLRLPNGLEYVNDLDYAIGGWEQ